MKYLDILSNYLKVFPEEQERQSKLMEYLKNTQPNQAIDWNNFNGHIVSSGFVYAIKEKKFLVLYHKDFKMFLYPGGHVEASDKDLLQAARREIQEETGLTDFRELNVSNDENVPIDIDTHKIPYNSRLNLPEHEHFDFQYVFAVDKIEDIQIDPKEHDSYRWIDVDEFFHDKKDSKIARKVKSLIDKM